MTTALAPYLPFVPSAEQATAANALTSFLEDPESEAFVLHGAAGTGKTALIRALATRLSATGTPFQLLAPTGRAARVASGATGLHASTIHRFLYVPEPLEGRPGVRLVRRHDAAQDAEVLLVDEASMVKNCASTTGHVREPGPLLQELLTAAERRNAKIVFVGDPCQLPPVGEERSPALEPSTLSGMTGTPVPHAALTEVYRQRHGSALLAAADALRRSIVHGQAAPALALPRLASEAEAVTTFLDAFDYARTDAAALLAWTNRAVDDLNRRARAHLGIGDRPLAPGDRVVLQRSWVANRRWLASGDQATVRSVGPPTTVVGLRFAEAELELDAAPDETNTVRALALLDGLERPGGRIPYEAEMELFRHAFKTNAAFRKSRHPADDPYLGALRLRHAFALTVHKAQGGEWDRVFLHPRLSSEARWRYTAVTRARANLESW